MQKKALLFIIAAGILWGTSGLFVSSLSAYGITTVQMTAVRGVVSFLCMLVYAVLFDRGAFRVRMRDLLLLAAAGISLFFVGSCYFRAMQLTSVSTAVILMYAAPIYVAVYSVLFFGERFSKMKITAVVLMLFGCVLVSGIIGGARFDGVGILFGVASGVSYGAYNILTKIALRRGIPPVSTTLYTFLFMSALALCLCDAVSLGRIALGSPAVLLPTLAALGVVTFVLPYICYTSALRTLPAGTCSAMAIVEPVSAAIFGAALLGEQIGLAALFGIAAVLGAVLLLSFEETREEKNDANRPLPSEVSEEIGNGMGR